VGRWPLLPWLNEDVEAWRTPNASSRSPGPATPTAACAGLIHDVAEELPADPHDVPPDGRVDLVEVLGQHVEQLAERAGGSGCGPARA
jgi:hypothetical protein